MTSYNVKYNSNQVNFNSNLYPNSSAPSAPWNGNAPPFSSHQNSPPPPPPPYQEAPTSSPNNSEFDRSINEQKYREIINKYEISHLFSQKLQFLFSFKIVFIFDDSGMNKCFLFCVIHRQKLLKITRDIPRKFPVFLNFNYPTRSPSLRIPWTLRARGGR